MTGLYADRQGRRHWCWPEHALFTLAGLLVLSMAHHYAILLVGAALDRSRLIGISVIRNLRVARMASGGRFGLAQSIFQVGGNIGQAVGPLAAALGGALGPIQYCLLCVVVRWCRARSCGTSDSGTSITDSSDCGTGAVHKFPGMVLPRPCCSWA